MSSNPAPHHHVAARFGTAAQAMVASHGEESLNQTMLSVPELAIFGETRLRKFAHEFVHYEELLDEIEEDGVERASA